MQKAEKFTDSGIGDNLHNDSMENGIHENQHNVKVSKNVPLLWSLFTAICYVRKGHPTFENSQAQCGTKKYGPWGEQWLKKQIVFFLKNFPFFQANLQFAGS